MNMLSRFRPYFTVFENFVSLNFIQAVNLMLPLILIPILESRVGLANFGLIMLAQYLTIIFITIGDFGMSVLGIRELARLIDRKSQIEDLVHEYYILKVFIFFLIALVYAILIIVVPRFNSDWEVFVLSFGIILGQIFAPDWFFHGIQKIKVLVVIAFVTKAVLLLLVILYVKSEDDYLLVPLMYSSTHIMGSVIGLAFVYKNMSKRRLKFIMPTKYFVFNSSKIFISDIGQQFSLTAPAIFLGLYQPDTVVGVYSAFEKIINASKKIFLPLFQAFYPHLITRNFKDQNKLFIQLIGLICIGSVVIYAVLNIFSVEILNLFFENPLILVNIGSFKILGLQVLISGITLYYLNLFIPVRKLFTQRAWITISTSFICLLASVTLPHRLGLIGAVYSSLITELSLIIICSIAFIVNYRQKAH
jgi:PST family polysaccharide transporter